MNSNDAARYAIEAMGVDRVDKGGNPYCLHLFETAIRLEETASTLGIPVTDEMRQAALNHDTAEDTDRTLDDMRRYGFSEEVVRLVDALTKRDGEKPIDYWMRIIEAGPEARAIKAADALSNSRIERLNRVPTEKDKRSQMFYLGLADLMMDQGAGVDELRDALLDNEADGRA